MAKLKNHNAEKTGLTLLGVLIATLILAVITIAVANLTGRSLREVGRSREEFIATNLAREGLELVQYVRDTNWLNTVAAQPWTGNSLGSEPLCDASGAERNLVIDRLTGGAVRVEVSNGTNENLFLVGNSYEHTPVPGQTSLYSRRIQIKCDKKDTPDNEHIEVNSHVRWQNRSQNHTVILKTHLYNWRQ